MTLRWHFRRLMATMFVIPAIWALCIVSAIVCWYYYIQDEDVPEEPEA